MVSKRNYPLVILILLFASGLSFKCESPVTDQQMEKDILILNAKISLPNVSGRIDHIAYDAANHLAFIAALGNNIVEVVDINTKKVIHTIAGLHEPQGIMYISSLQRLVVANGDEGACDFFDAKTYDHIGAVNLKDDADNVRYDNATGLLYVGYGNGGIAIIDAQTMKQITSIPLDGHPESFQIDKTHNRLYVNVPDAGEIQVADITTHAVIATWKNIVASSNFPMAFDEENNRLFIGCRSPATLRMINAQTGKDISSLSCSGDADDVFYINEDSIVLVSAGKGFIDVFKINNNALQSINHIATSTGARTCAWLAAEKKLLLAVPAHGGNEAALWIYDFK